MPPGFGMEFLSPVSDRIESTVAMAMERVPTFARAGVKTIVRGPITSQRMNRGMRRSPSGAQLLRMAMMHAPPHLHEALPAGSRRP